MKVVIQRVKEAKVEVENKVVGKIEKGFLVFLGITHTDTKEQADYLVKKLCNLRVFTDREGKMNLGLKEVVGELLIVSQFTLYADGRDADWKDNPQSYDIRRGIVTSKSVLRQPLASSGGVAISVREATKEEVKGLKKL